MIAAALAAVARLVSGARATWASAPPTTGQRVFFGNHSSHLDFLVVWAALPPPARARTRPVAAQDYWQRGRLRRYLSMRVFRAVLVERRSAPVDRAAPTGSRGHSSGEAAIERMLTALRAGDSLIVFPEGTRGEGDRVAPFKSGLYHLCKGHPGLELVPVRIENLNRVLRVRWFRCR